MNQQIVTLIKTTNNLTKLRDHRRHQKSNKRSTAMQLFLNKQWLQLPKQQRDSIESRTSQQCVTVVNIKPNCDKDPLKIETNLVSHVNI